MADYLRLRKWASAPFRALHDELVVWAEDDGSLHTMDEDGTETEVGAGGNGGSQPYTGPFTIYALQSQAIDASGEQPDGGTLTVAYDGVDSDPIASDADNAAITAALEAIPSLNAKVTVSSGGFEVPGSGICEITLDQSLAPFAAFTVSDNSWTTSAAPTSDPLIYTAGQTVTELFTPSAGDVIEDFVISVPQNEAWGTGSDIGFSPQSGDADWRVNASGDGLLLDVEDASENWTVSQNGDGPRGFHSVALAMAANAYVEDGAYPTLPCVCNVPSALLANVNRIGQGTGGIVKVWVKTSAASAPA